VEFWEQWQGWSELELLGSVSKAGKRQYYHNCNPLGLRAAMFSGEADCHLPLLLPPEQLSLLAWRCNHCVRHTLQCLWEAKLFCNPKKCEFHQSKIEFLGVDISRNRFKMDDKKTSVITDWQSLTSIRAVHQFIGFINFYQRWIPGFSEVTRPLHNLFQKNQPWQWTENEQTTFEILKWRVSQAPVLVHADLDAQFHMETDASNYTYGAVLSQKQPNG
jgi:hypothetical protein